jgi:hypothetical protein
MKGMGMRIYLVAVVIALGAAVMIINACMLQTSSKRAVPLNIYQLK